jgi:hypothetical protein
MGEISSFLSSVSPAFALIIQISVITVNENNVHNDEFLQFSITMDCMNISYFQLYTYHTALHDYTLREEKIELTGAW